jgi:methionyl-tRNA formyltransferase
MFPGKYAISRAYMAFKRGEIGGTGVMVHRVALEVDAGKCILFKKVKIYEKDSIRNLEDRMHQVEHELLIRAIKRLFRPPSRPKTAKKGAKSSEKRRKSTKKSQFWHKINEKQQKRGQNQRKAAKNGEKGVKSIKVNRNQRKTGQK